METLPVMLLDVRTAWREDFGATAAEMIYGQPLRLPSGFFGLQSNNGLNSGLDEKLPQWRMQSMSEGRG